MGKKLIITGAYGFLGSYVKKRFLKGGYRETDLFCPRHKNYNLTRLEDVRRMYNDFKAEQVLHIAADIGGIGYSKNNPGRQYYNNTLMNTFVLDEAMKAGIKKFLGIGSVCAYPKFAPIPFQEDDLWNGYPEESNAAYGLTKKMMLEQSKAYRQQYGFNAIHLVQVNLYGPGDNFDLENSHVIPATIRKIDEAKEKGISEVVMWGDGTPTREFLFVEDSAEAIFQAMQHYDKPDPVNIGTGTDISIQNLVKLIGQLMDYSGDFLWDTTKPNGQPKRRLDVTRAEKEFGFKTKVDFTEGLKKTIEWYYANIKKNNERG